MSTSQIELRNLSDRATQHLLNKNGTSRGTKAGWLMISTILVEAWDLYAISFLMLFITDAFHPSTWQLGAAAAFAQGGALVGAFIGGWLADRIGRRRMFLGTMALFIVFAVAQGFATNMTELIVLRFLLGVPLGSDISTGYAYIMESMPRGKREVMGNRWQGMFALGEVTAIIVVTIMYLTGMDTDLLWRIGLALGALPALALLIGRRDLRETPTALIQKGKFKQAKVASQELFDDSLDMLPDEDFDIERPRARDFLADIWRDETRRKVSLYAWISNAMQAAEFSAFAFYIPVIFTVVGVAGTPDQFNVTTNFITAGLYVVAMIAGFTAPVVTPKIGHRGIGQIGFGLAFVSLLVAALALHQSWNVVVVLAAAGVMWGHYWDASNGMTLAAMVAPNRYKATASGFGYVFVKLTFFVLLLVFPTGMSVLGPVKATLLCAAFPLVGFLAAKFILPEVYGYVERENDEVVEASVDALGAQA
ncbi:MAG: MFS transporter [Nocardioidaceae bacterium]|nr:MFS transporter [Nocardioidaceae bacterium]MCL2613680.1 MFS transporter [Nocardioidaceae bacterium]